MNWLVILAYFAHCSSYYYGYIEASGSQDDSFSTEKEDAIGGIEETSLRLLAKAKETNPTLIYDAKAECAGQEFTNVTGAGQKLTKHLRAKHDKLTPPDGVIHIEYEIELVHIMNIDELKQTLTALVYVDEKWIDPSLAWDPVEFGNASTHWIPQSSIWLPDIIIFNMIAHDNLLESVRAPVRLCHNGLVTHSYPAVFTVTCTINIKNFPLDEQICDFKVASWEYGRKKIVLDVRIDHSLQHYSPNEEWELTAISIKQQDYQHGDFMVSNILYQMEVKRKPLFYLITLIVPSYIMCTVSSTGLFASFSSTGERQERFTLGVTSILTMAVLSLVVSEEVPHSSKHVPLLLGYFMFLICMVTAATGVTSFTMWVHKRGSKGCKPPPGWLMFLFRLRRVSEQQKVSPERTGGMIAGAISKMGGGPFGASSSHQGGSKHWKMRASVYRKATTSGISECENGQKSPQQTDNTEADQFSNSLIAVMEAVRGELRNRRLVVERELRIGVDDADNVWVLLAERLDSLFMVLFLTTLTVPTIYIVYPVLFLGDSGGPRISFNGSVTDGGLGH